jgi:hypothetical protein
MKTRMSLGVVTCEIVSGSMVCWSLMDLLGMYVLIILLGVSDGNKYLNQ